MLTRDLVSRIAEMPRVLVELRTCGKRWESDKTNVVASIVLRELTSLRDFLNVDVVRDSRVVKSHKDKLLDIAQGQAAGQL